MNLFVSHTICCCIPSCMAVYIREQRAESLIKESDWLLGIFLFYYSVVASINASIFQSNKFNVIAFVDRGKN